MPARDMVKKVVAQTVSLASRSLSTVGVALELVVQQCWYMLMKEIGGSVAILV